MEVPSSEPAFQEPVFEGDEEETEPIDEELVVHLHQADMEQELAREMSKISAKASVEQEPPAMQTKVPYKAQEVDQNLLWKKSQSRLWNRRILWIPSPVTLW